ncbi:hypothetical protein LVJ94_01510 [Pendulispora rubella]|uniref:Transmembrane protein n=1 Tax=Pendulispora rubella TaxID=2741070 RepID=A0ABZ2L7Z8_9BACT
MERLFFAGAAMGKRLEKTLDCPPFYQDKLVSSEIVALRSEVVSHVRPRAGSLPATVSLALTFLGGSLGGVAGGGVTALVLTIAAAPAPSWVRAMAMLGAVGSAVVLFLWCLRFVVSVIHHASR